MACALSTSYRWHTMHMATPVRRSGAVLTATAALAAIGACTADATASGWVVRAGLLDTTVSVVELVAPAQWPSQVAWLGEVEADFPVVGAPGLGVAASALDGVGVIIWSSIDSIQLGKQRRVGVRGDGPGEYRYIAFLGRCSDGELTAFDPARLILSTYSTSTFEHVERRAPPLSRRGTVIGCQPSGALLSLLAPPTVEGYQPGLNRWPIHLAELASDGGVDSLASTPGSEWWFDPASDWIPTLTWRDETLGGVSAGGILVVQAASGEALLSRMPSGRSQRIDLRVGCLAADASLLEAALQRKLDEVRSPRDKQEFRAALNRAAAAAPYSRRFIEVIGSAATPGRFFVVACHDATSNAVFALSTRDALSVTAIGLIPIDARVAGELDAGQILVAQDREAGLRFGVIRYAVRPHRSSAPPFARRTDEHGTKGSVVQRWHRHASGTADHDFGFE